MAVVKAGVSAIARIVLSGFGVATMTSHDLGLPTAYLAAFTIVAASLIALTKDDIKARLAYSTISQLSYIIIGIAMLTPMALEGGMVHIVNHAFSKITLFFAAGAIFVVSRQRKISAMGGLGRRMPWTFGAFAVASLSMIGVPPVCGFVTKWYLVNGAIDGGHMVLLAALLISTLLNAMYFTPVVLRGFFGKPQPGVALEEYTEAPVAMVAALCFTAAVSVLLGLFPGIITDFIGVFTHVAVKNRRNHGTGKLSGTHASGAYKGLEDRMFVFLAASCGQPLPPPPKPSTAWMPFRGSGRCSAWRRRC